MITKLKINGFPSEAEYLAMSFGRQIEHHAALAAFKATAKRDYVSQKRKHWRLALANFISLHKVTEYYCKFNADTNVRDDCFEIYYR